MVHGVVDELHAGRPARAGVVHVDALVRVRVDQVVRDHVAADEAADLDTDAVAVDGVAVHRRRPGVQQDPRPGVAEDAQH